MDVDVGAGDRQHFPRLARHPGARDEGMPRGQRTKTEVLRHREVVAERQLLMDDADAGGKRLLRP